MPEIKKTEAPHSDLPEERIYGLSDEHSKELLKAVESGERDQVIQLLAPLHAADIADFIDSISAEKRRAFINLIRKNFNPEILVELNSDVKEEILKLLGTEESAQAIVTLDTDDAVDVIEDLDKKGQRALLKALPEKQRVEVEESLAYPEDSAGRLTDRNVITVPEFWTVGQTIDFLRSEKNLPDDFYQIFVVDPKIKPVGGVMLSKVIRSERPVLMKDIMNIDLKLIKTDMDQEEVAFVFRQYGLASAPVVNSEGRMIGVITVDDIVDVIEEEAHEDMMHLVGMSSTDMYSDTRSTIIRRMPWLMVNFITAILASWVVGLFEGTIAKFASLAVLMPIVASMGGNAGTQTLTVAVRAIATRDLTTNNIFRFVGKEAFVGFTNGLSFAFVTGLTALIWYHNPYLSIVIGVASIATLTLAGFFGTIIPICLVKMKIDPAIASSVILTTITDVSAFGVFLGLATFIIETWPQLLH